MHKFARRCFSQATGKKLSIVGISGSLRKGSYNTALLRAAQKLVPADVELTVAEIGDLPMFNEDLENSPTAAVTRFKAAVAAADAVLFVTPEHNYSVPAALKNAIDQGSRPPGKSVWAEKPIGLMSASMGSLGGIRAHLQLRQMFSPMPVFHGGGPTADVMVGSAHERIKDGKLEPFTEKKVQEYLELFAKWVRKQQ